MPTPDSPGPFDLASRPVHLGLGATCAVQPPFTGELSWYEGYVSRHGEDGTEGRLVALHSFDKPWDVWECHPHGEELVVVTAGELTLIQEIDGKESRVRIGTGQFAINPAGVWHTADAQAPVTALFVTAGAGTEHRPR